MKGTRNRITPFLLIILFCLVWLLLSVIVYKVMKNNDRNSIKKLKLDDDLVQELYSYTTDQDIIIYSESKYDISNLPSEYIFSKATRFMTIDDIEFLDDNQIRISYESLDGAIKTTFGPEFEYDLSNINKPIETYFEMEEHKLVFNVKYEKKSNSYVGSYTKVNKENDILVKHELVQATMNGSVNLKVGYVFYKKNEKYQVCDNYECGNIIKELDSLDNYDYEEFITISLKKSSDDIFYYDSNS